MKATGIIRRVDDLGRIVIPKEIRRVNGIEEDTPMEIFVGKQGVIVLKKYTPGCEFCDSLENLVEFGGSKVCKECAKRILDK